MTAPTQDRPRVRPSIDPRIRDRRIEVIREAGRRRLRITLVIASAIVVIGLAYLTVQSPLLDIDHIRVTGNRREPTAAIERAARVHLGSALLFANEGAIARRIEQLPWVAHARVKRDLPGTLAIAVTEYAPTAYVRLSPVRVALVASTGRVIAHAKKVPPGAMEILGEKVSPRVGALLSPPAAANVMKQLPSGLVGQVRAIDVGGPDVALVVEGAVPAATTCKAEPGSVPGVPEIRLGSLDLLHDKGESALAVLDHLAGRPFTYVDVSAPLAPVSC